MEHGNHGPHGSMPMGSRGVSRPMAEHELKQGGHPGESETDGRTPPIGGMPKEPGAVVGASVWGMTFPWTLALSTALGIAMMAVPGVLGVEKPASNIFRLAGALVVVTAVIAMGEPLRVGRCLNVLLGVLLAAAPWILEGGGMAAQIAGLIAGVAIIALSLPRGPILERFGGWDRLVR